MGRAGRICRGRVTHGPASSSQTTGRGAAWGHPPKRSQDRGGAGRKLTGRVIRGWDWCRIGSGRCFPSEETLTRDRALERYQPQFDGLRALAVLTVMVDHFSADVPNFPLPDWIHLGATGVRLFLVLSGYFITASLRRARDRMDAGALSAGKAIGAFYWRRSLRIGPAYLVFAAIALLLNLGAVRQNWPWIFTGTVNWLIAWKDQWPLAISHLWSICVQEQFYLFWPLLYFAAAAQMDALRHYCGGVGRHRISNRLRDLFSADDCSMGLAIRQPRLARGRGSTGLVWRAIGGIARRLGASVALFVDVNGLLRSCKQRPDATLKSVLVEPLEAGRCVCDSGCANGDRLRWKHRASFLSNAGLVSSPDESATRTLHLPHPGGDGFQSLVAVTNAIPDHDTVSAFGRVRDRYPVYRGVVVAIVGTTDQPAAWRRDWETLDPIPRGNWEPEGRSPHTPRLILGAESSG